MRRLRRIAAALLLAVLIALVGFELRAHFLASAALRAQGVYLNESKASVAYRLSRDEVLEFAITDVGDTLRVLSHAVLADTDAKYDEPDRRWRYALDYELIGTNDKVVYHGRYHHRTTLTQLHNTQRDTLHARYFLLGTDEVPADGRSMLVSLRQSADVSKLRLRLASADSAIQQVLVRAYEQDILADYKLGYKWRRLSPDQKESLARGNVYGADLLRETETRNLMLNRWRPLGPSGALGEDYQSQTLYEIVGVDWIKLDGEPVLQQGLFVNQAMHGVIPLPHAGASVRLVFLQSDALTPVSRPEQAAPVIVRWYGRSIEQRREFSYVPKLGEPFRAQLSGGLLEVISTAPWVIRAYDDGAGVEGEGEITPVELKLRTFEPDTAHDLIYAVDHEDDTPTPMRIDVRVKQSAVQVPSPLPVVSYTLLDAQDAVLYQGQLMPGAQLSFFDREAYMPASEALRYYFKFPARVKKIRLSAPGAILITAYTRPLTLALEQRVPEDYYAYERDQRDIERMPAWFLVQPSNEQVFQQIQRTEMIAVQHRPPTDDPRLLSGQYQWDEYRPGGFWRARNLLMPRSGAVAVRDEARVSVYRSVVANREHHFVFQGVSGQQEMQPTLIFDKAPTGRFPVSVSVDGVQVVTTRLQGPRGQLGLVRLKAGRHRLRIDAPAGSQWFVNYAGGDNTSYLKRLANRVGGSELVFNYQKTSNEEEVLSGQLFTPSSRRVTLRVQVTQDAPSSYAPYQGWTYSQRIIDMKPESMGAVRVLDTVADEANFSQRFFIPLDRDLPPGRYRIRIRVISGKAEYLALYRLAPGMASVRRFFHETLL